MGHLASIGTLRPVWHLLRNPQIVCLPRPVEGSWPAGRWPAAGRGRPARAGRRRRITITPPDGGI